MEDMCESVGWFWMELRWKLGNEIVGGGDVNGSGVVVVVCVEVLCCEEGWGDLIEVVFVGGGVEWGVVVIVVCE